MSVTGNWRVSPHPRPEGYYRRGEAIGRPVMVRTERQSRGQVVYARHCCACHQGGEGVRLGVSDAYRPSTESSLVCRRHAKP